MAKIISSAVLRTNLHHRPAPSLFYFPGLTCGPLYDPQLFSFSKRLESLHSDILNEYKDLRKRQSSGSDYVDKQEHKLHSGQWDWNSFVQKGELVNESFSSCPVTASFLISLSSPKLMTGTPFSFSFFSTLKRQSKISAHCGPCNIRIRCHFPLVVPEGDCGMQVGEEIVQWIPGKPVFFDDSFEHHGMKQFLLV